MYKFNVQSLKFTTALDKILIEFYVHDQKTEAKHFH